MFPPLKTLGFALEKAGPAAVMRYIDVLFAFIWSATFLHKTINPWSVFGAALIMMSAVTVTWNKIQVGENREVDVATIDHAGEVQGGGEEEKEEEKKEEEDEEEDEDEDEEDTGSEGSFEI